MFLKKKKEINVKNQQQLLSQLKNGLGILQNML
jgi:hypothetical protein